MSDNKDEFTKIDGHDHLLLPCPFCGSPAELWEYERTPGHFVKAAMCTQHGDDWHDGECPMYLPNDGFYKMTKREAIEAWNTRNSN